MIRPRSMRATSFLSMFVPAAALVCAACGSSAPAKEPAPTTSASVQVSTNGASVISLDLSPDSLRVDKVGARNGFLAPDGLRDLAFTAQVTGPIVALFLQSTDEHGEPDNVFRVNTMLAAEEAPEGLGGTLELGRFSPGIGVYEGGKIINKDDGSINLAPGPHALTLYTSNPGTVKSGSHLRLFAVLSDKSLVRGPVYNVP